MAKVTRAGYFGWEESLKVSGSYGPDARGAMDWTLVFPATWIPGQCFKLDPTDPTYAVLCDTVGEQIYGIAIDDYDELAEPPKAAKVTILHGHSLVTIDHSEEKATYGTTPVPAGFLAYEKTSVEASSPMDLLWTNASGKLSTTTSGSANRPAGFVVQVPTYDNAYTLIFILFG